MKTHARKAYLYMGLCLIGLALLIVVIALQARLI
jgi:hypothetical protein